ncbi:hypothetical protein [Leifsonia sp. fls2-241-R2A-40a]|uniref:hypothetical protein n=1 Tax=Leifsonia sp. fls2-241-R2A-40a TaxID=3040290 RepID=UPI0025508AA6|nr:hypothetical protein [Leifsonia sp. fls2-241-R2A-40a]
MILATLLAVASVVLLAVAGIAHLALFPYATEKTVVRWLLPVMAVPVAGPLAWFVFALATTVRVRWAIGRMTRLTGIPPVQQR